MFFVQLHKVWRQNLFGIFFIWHDIKAFKGHISTDYTWLITICLKKTRLYSFNFLFHFLFFFLFQYVCSSMAHEHGSVPEAFPDPPLFVFQKTTRFLIFPKQMWVSCRTCLLECSIAAGDSLWVINACSEL